MRKLINYMSVALIINATSLTAACSSCTQNNNNNSQKAQDLSYTIIENQDPQAPDQGILTPGQPQPGALGNRIQQARDYLQNNPQALDRIQQTQEFLQVSS